MSQGVRAARFAVLVCEVRADGLWPVLRYVDARRASVMKAPPMHVEGPEKTMPIALPAIRRCLEGMLDGPFRGDVAAMLEELVTAGGILEGEVHHGEHGDPQRDQEKNQDKD
jgi:hypothetical protein